MLTPVRSKVFSTVPNRANLVLQRLIVEVERLRSSRSHQLSEPRSNKLSPAQRPGTGMLRPGAASEITICVCDVTCGSRLMVSRTQRPSCAIYLGLEGNVQIQTEQQVFSVPQGQMELFPICSRVGLQTSLEARGIFVTLPASMVHDWNFPSDAGLLQPIALPFQPTRLDDTDRTKLAIELLRRCMEQAAVLVEADGPQPHLAKVSELVIELLHEILPERRPEQSSANLDGPHYLTIIEQYIIENIAESITISDLATASGVSTRTVQEGFRRFRGYSPMRFLREQRLIATRRDLLNPQTISTVTDAAFKWGFNHLGRFSSYYAMQFGERPSETLQMAKTRAKMHQGVLARNEGQTWT